MKRNAAIILLLVILLLTVGCYTSPASSTAGTSSDTKSTVEVAGTLQANQPTPTDIDYSLERYNLIRRAYWVNGQREKANTLPCSIERPLGYIVLFTDNGGVVGKFIVDGKVSSLNSYLTPDSAVYEIGGDGLDGRYLDEAGLGYGGRDNYWIADVDGSYGMNDNGIFFFTPAGQYVEWTGTYLYSDIPFEIADPIITYQEVSE